MSAALGNRAEDALAIEIGPPLVVVVDDDEGMRDGVRDVLRSVGIDSLGFSCTTDLLAEPLPDRPGCLILDVRLPGLSGLDLQAKLNGMGNKLPIVFMTGYADVPMSVRAMKAGATDFLTKPFRDQELLDAVSVALERNRTRRLELRVANEASKSASSLTPRELEVMEAVVRGLLNKQVAHLLEISEVTVKIHRGNMMRKMNATSFADLVRKVEILKSLA